MARRRPFAPLRRALRTRDVFGKPVKSGGVTVVPVASVLGGGGGGFYQREGGSSPSSPAGPDPESNEGLGFGFLARPVGAYVIRDGKVRWRPAVDVTRLALGALTAGVVVAGIALRKR
jgi:uncharacterized spore protein YtfJ